MKWFLFSFFIYKKWSAETVYSVDAMKIRTESGKKKQSKIWMLFERSKVCLMFAVTIPKVCSITHSGMGHEWRHRAQYISGTDYSRVTQAIVSVVGKHQSLTGHAKVGAAHDWTMTRRILPVFAYYLYYTNYVFIKTRLTCNFLNVIVPSQTQVHSAVPQWFAIFL